MLLHGQKGMHLVHDEGFYCMLELVYVAPNKMLLLYSYGGAGLRSSLAGASRGAFGRARLGLFYAIDTWRCLIATYLANLARGRVAAWCNLIRILLAAFWRSVSVQIRWAARAAFVVGWRP